jgi:transposase InsO family protein
MRMERIYYKTDSPGAFSSIEKLYREYNKVNPGVTKKQVKDFLLSSATYTTYKERVLKFPRREFRSSRPGNILAADTAHMKDLAAFNDNVHYLLVVIDLYSRLLFVKPLVSITSKHIIQAFDEILSEVVWTTSRLVTDDGSEFTNKTLKQYLASKNIQRYSTYNKIIKVSPAERVIKTVKVKLYKYMHYTKSMRYIDHLQDIVFAYNVSIHTSLVGHTPFDVYLLHDPLEISDLLVKMYKKNRSAIKKSSSPLTVGQHVRLQASDHSLTTFHRGYSPKFLKYLK